MNANPTAEQPSPPAATRLTSLAAVQLNPEQTAYLASARLDCHGDAHWRARKLAEAFELFALAEYSRRYVVLALDVTEDFRAMLAMRVPVPCRRAADGNLVVAREARLFLHYRRENLQQPSPGFEFVQILAPGGVWHPQVRATFGAPPPLFPEPQPLCLGARLPAGIRVRELLIRTYGALSMQSVQLDAADAAGVMNREAADWWLQIPNRGQLPLTREPFAPRPAVEVKS